MQDSATKARKIGTVYKSMLTESRQTVEVLRESSSPRKRRSRKLAGLGTGWRMVCCDGPGAISEWLSEGPAAHRGLHSVADHKQRWSAPQSGRAATKAAPPD